jgi:hypothetical protein
LRNLEPSPLVDLAWKLTRAEFVQQLDVPLLLVRVEEPHSELAAALREIGAQGGARLEPTLGFETRSEAFDDVRRSRRPTVFSAPQVAVRFVRALHFAIPLRKRPEAGKSFSERISVGRARNNDVVLRSESVSKFHAWLRCDEGDVYYVGDASSRNGTRVNGVALPAHKPHRLAAGDEIAFGAVETVLCPSAVLWDAIRTA